MLRVILSFLYNLLWLFISLYIYIRIILHYLKLEMSENYVTLYCNSGNYSVHYLCDFISLHHIRNITYVYTPKILSDCNNETRLWFSVETDFGKITILISIKITSVDYLERSSGDKSQYLAFKLHISICRKISSGSTIWFFFIYL